MIRSARDLEDGARLRAEVCVVGAGAAGITTALELAAAGRGVVLLESGGLEPDPATQALYEGELTGADFGTPEQPVGLEDTRLRWLGGTTNHWAGFCRPLDAVDFEGRPDLPLSGWPIERAALDPYYERALERLRLGPNRFDWPYWQERLGLPDPLVNSELVRTTAFQVRPLRFGTTFREELEQAEAIDVVLHANAVGLDLEPGGDRLARVRARTLEGVGLSVEADAFVVGLGGLETPRLLLASDDDRPGGLGNELDQVGRYFCEHLQAYSGVAVADADPDDLAAVYQQGAPIDGTEDEDGDPGLVRGVLTTAAEVQRERGMLSFAAQLVTGIYDQARPIETSGLGPDHASAVFAAGSGGQARAALYLLVSGEQQLNAESRITLSDSVDALGMPRLALDWRFTELDRASMVEGVRVVGEDLGRLGLGRVQLTPGTISAEAGAGFQVDADSADPDGFPLAIGFHHMCTTRMAADPAEGVVDADLRVHSVENLFLAGSGSFATAGSATPTLTVVALSTRLADHLDRAVLR